ncbi:hypothetical protein, partial [Aeromonas hydrophila]|uniref:hypothetical protein n=1 Tax=Aeromonas hydrophila TaxID=644 RepID=UPI003EC55E98
AQQRQDRRGQVQAATAAATGLACFIFRFLRRPQPKAAFDLTKNPGSEWANSNPRMQIAFF